MRIAIIGGGWTGLVLAHRLSGKGHELHLIEKGEQLGGLATYHDYRDFFWDRFYHVILPMDRSLIEFIEEIGLGHEMRWRQTFTGVYVDKKFYSVSSTMEFLRFPPLSLFQKFRLGLTILLGSRIRDWKNLEKITAEDWLIKYSGRGTYEKFWKPLLLAKLGESYRKVSAVFIWTYIKRLFEARDSSSAKKEQMGYVSGGYRRLLLRLEDLLVERGASLRKNATVESIEAVTAGGLKLVVDGVEEHFDKVIFTGPLDILQKIAEPSLLQVERANHKVDYLGVICVVLVLRRQLTPYYVLNIADASVPFTAVIGMSALVDQEETNGKFLVYLPKYILSTDPFLRTADEDVKREFLRGLHAMYPDLKEEDIVSVHVNRAFKVQPLQVLNYSSIVPGATTRHEDFYILNTSQFVNDTLNNDSVTRHVNRFADQYSQHFAAAAKEVSQA